MDAVLLLNVNYLPLRIISLHRALTLLYQEKAELIEATEETISSPSKVMQMPSVIRLNYYVKTHHYDNIMLNRRAVMARDDGICQYVGCDKKATTLDHVHPRSLGGTHTWDNVVACCSKCNSKKADIPLSKLGWKLKRQPKRPHGNIWLASGLKTHPVWSKYAYDG